MRKSQVNQQEKKCKDCHPRDEKNAQIQKELIKHKLENDTLMLKLKQLSDESKKIIDSIVVTKPTKTVNQEQQEEVTKKELENAKKQMEFYEKRIKSMEKAQESHSFDAYSKTVEDLKKLESDIEKAKAKNSELNSKQREYEKILLNEQPVMSRNDMRKEIELLMSKLNYEQKVLEKKKENRDKILKKIDETETKYKELCQKHNVTSIQRPDFTVSPQELESNKPRLRQFSKSKSEVNVFKPPVKNSKENAVAQESSKPIRVSESMILASKQNVGRITKNIKSFEKSHIQRLNELQLQEKQISASKAEAEKDLEIVQQECVKALQVLKELQRLPRDSVIEASKIQSLVTEVSPVEDTLSLANSSKALSTKSKFRKEVQGIKTLTEQTQQWRDFETLPDDKQYKINNFKQEQKLSINYQMEMYFNPFNHPTQIILLIKEITEYIQEISGFFDSTHITLLKFKTSYFKEYTAGDTNLDLAFCQQRSQQISSETLTLSKIVKQKIFQNRIALVQLGVEIMKKDIFIDNSRSVTSLKASNFSQQVENQNKKIKEEQELAL